MKRFEYIIIKEHKDTVYYLNKKIPNSYKERLFNYLGNLGWELVVSSDKISSFYKGNTETEDLFYLFKKEIISTEILNFNDIEELLSLEKSYIKPIVIHKKNIFIENLRKFSNTFNISEKKNNFLLEKKEINIKTTGLFVKKEQEYIINKKYEIYFSILNDGNLEVNIKYFTNSIKNSVYKLILNEESSSESINIFLNQILNC